MYCTISQAISHQTADKLIQPKLKQLILDPFTSWMLDGSQRILHHCSQISHRSVSEHQLPTTILQHRKEGRPVTYHIPPRD